MPGKRKQAALFWIVFTAFIFILLAASLANLNLSPGWPFPGALEQPRTISPALESTGKLIWVSSSFSPIQGILAFGFVLIVVYLALNLLSWVNLKKLVRYLLIALILFAFLISIPYWPFFPQTSSSSEPLITTAPLNSEIPITPLDEPPQLLIWILIGGLIILVIFLGFSLFTKVVTKPATTTSVLYQAEKALGALHSGENLTEVIVRCYLEMQQCILEGQGIERDAAMTASEFEDLLVTQGFPPGPIRQLTHLFEDVRYGHKYVGKFEEQTAITSLTAIVEYCQEEG